MVIGKVGAGKSTFLHSLLGENFITGSFSSNALRRRMAYVEQEPFILSDSVKANICFGLPYEQELFERVSEAACLLTDYKQLAKGADTLIGERGVNISGGQKARVSMARALYSGADIFLLDDPFSAVDPAVADQLMESCVQQTMKGKTRVIVTHRLNLLQNADQVLFLENGRMQFAGSYAEFIQKSYDLA